VRRWKIEAEGRVGAGDAGASQSLAMRLQIRPPAEMPQHPPHLLVDPSIVRIGVEKAQQLVQAQHEARRGQSRSRQPSQQIKFACGKTGCMVSPDAPERSQRASRSPSFHRSILSGRLR
jgi:hypothetical protein